MKNIKTKLLAITIICLYLLSNSKSFAQKEILYFFRDIPQVTQYNPSITPNYGFYTHLGVGTINFGFKTSNLSYHDLIHQHPVYADSLQLDLEGFRNTLGDNNFIDLNYDMNIFGLGFKIGRNYFNYDLSFNLDSRFNFSKGLLELVLYGSDANNGNIKLLDGHLLEANCYFTNSIGYAREINDRLRVGLKAKLLIGLANIHTNNANLELNFHETDNISTHGEIDIITSNVIGDLNINSILSENASTNFVLDENFEALLSNVKNKIALNNFFSSLYNNKGFAFDIGATYRLHNNFELSFSAVDIYSTLNWATHTARIVNNKPYEEIIFEGITLGIDSLGNNTESQLTALADSLTSALDLSTQKINPYTTNLPTKLYFGATYHFWAVNYLHALLSTKIHQGKIYDTRLALYYSLHSRLLSLSIGNAFKINNFFNPSAVVSFKLGLFQIYTGANLYSKHQFNVADFSGGEIYFGINTVIGRKKHWKETDIPKKAKTVTIMEEEEISEENKEETTLSN